MAGVQENEMAKALSESMMNRRPQPPVATPYSTLGLEDIKGRAGSLAKDQNGSRKIQNLFD